MDSLYTSTTILIYIHVMLRMVTNRKTSIEIDLKIVRAQVSEDVIIDENTGSKLKNVPQKTSPTIICIKGIKYPKVLNSATKISFSLMFCGKDAEQNVPLVVNYNHERSSKRTV